MYKLLFILTSLSIISCLPKDDIFPFTQDFKEKLSETAINKCLEENKVSRESCDIKNCFASPITLIALKELLEETDKALKKADIKYWVDSGSAIGAHRHFLLPWDDDVDLGVFQKDFSAEKRAKLKAELINQGFLFAPLTSPPWLRKSTGVDGVWQVSYGKARFMALLSRYKPDINPVDAENLWQIYHGQNGLYPSLDIFEFIEKEPGKYIYAAATLAKNQWKNQSLEKEKLEGTNKITIFGKVYPGIADQEAYFKIAYNTDDMLHDFVIFQDHKPRCEKLRFRDIRKHPELLEYMFSYLKFIFGSDFDIERARARFK